MAKTGCISLRLSEETKSQLKALADADNRTITNYIETLIKEKIEEKKENQDGKDFQA